MCKKILATHIPDDDSFRPSCDELASQGHVAVPNFGWFCAQDCGWKFEKEFGIHFQRDSDGNINYY